MECLTVSKLALRSSCLSHKGLQKKREQSERKLIAQFYTSCTCTSMQQQTNINCMRAFLLKLLYMNI